MPKYLKMFKFSEKLPRHNQEIIVFERETDGVFERISSEVRLFEKSWVVDESSPKAPTEEFEKSFSICYNGEKSLAGYKLSYSIDGYDIDLNEYWTTPGAFLKSCLD